MIRKKGIQNETGMTLVEILAALVILGIVFVGFMTIFPQMTSFNEKTYTKLDTMNLAREKLEYIKNDSLPALTDCISFKNGLCTIKDNFEEDYQVYLTYKIGPEPDLEAESEGQVSLYQVHIMYFHLDQSLNTAPISETFGYVVEEYEEEGG